jgi:hypothetical protein
MDLLRQSRESNKTTRHDGGHNNRVKGLDHCTVPVAQPLALGTPSAFAAIWLLFDGCFFASHPQAHGDWHHKPADFCKSLKPRYNPERSQEMAEQRSKANRPSVRLAADLGAG